MNAKKLGFERNIHKLVYTHGFASPLLPKEKSALRAHLYWLTRPPASILANRHMMTSQFRSERGKTRKREISRDFSRFFDSEFFRSFIDPFCPFRCCVRTRTHEKGFFASSRKQSTLWLDSDLRKRSLTVRKSRRFTNCLQTHLIPPQIVRI